MQDYETYDVAERLRDALAVQMDNVVPKTVLNKLRRANVDVNREINEAAFGLDIPQQVHAEYHGAVEEAIASIGVSGRPGFILDIHGYNDLSDPVEDRVTWIMWGKTASVTDWF